MATTKSQAEKTFKISQLEEITNLDNKDLFLISDYEGGKCYTKKLTFNKLMRVLANNPQLIQAILSADQVDQTICEKVETAVSAYTQITTIDGGDSTTVFSD